MKLRLLAIALMALAATAVVTARHGTGALAKEPGPSAGTQLVGGLLSPRGMAIGPDGMIYIAEAGSGGETVVGSGEGESHSGLTGRISKVDPATGARTTVADKLPSNAGAQGDAVGAADVAFLGDTLYYLQTHGGEAYGFPDNPTGVYRVHANGTVTLVADIGAFVIANPVADIQPGGGQLDIEPGGNPYAMIVRGGSFYVVDGNQNQVMKVTASGSVSRLNEFPGHPVSTGITYSGGGPFYVAGLGKYPFAAADGKVFQVGATTGTVTTVAGGYSSLTDVEFGPGGKLYALQWGDQADAGSPIPWVVGSGRILEVDTATGTLTPIVTGLVLPDSLIFVDGTAYVATGGVSIPGIIDGAIWKIPSFSAITPPAPEPTAAPAAPTATPKAGTGVIVAPDTGSGGAGDTSSGGWLATMLTLSAIGALAVFAATRMVWKRTG